MPSDCRSTCATYLHNSPGIPLTTMQACMDQLGHTEPVARKSYVGKIPEGVVDLKADTLEQAMGLSGAAPGVERRNITKLA